MPEEWEKDRIHFVANEKRLRIRFVPAYLSAWVVLGERYEIDHHAEALKLDINCLLDLDAGARERLLNLPPGERDDPEPWLLRGTLLSGSIVMLNPAEALINARRFLWAPLAEAG